MNTLLQELYAAKRQYMDPATKKAGREAFIKTLQLIPQDLYSDIFFATQIEGKDILLTTPFLSENTLYATLINNEPNQKGATKKETANVLLYDDICLQLMNEIIGCVEASEIQKQVEKEKTRIKTILERAEQRKNDKEI